MLLKLLDVSGVPSTTEKSECKVPRVLGFVGVEYNRTRINLRIRGTSNSIWHVDFPLQPGLNSVFDLPKPTVSQGNRRTVTRWVLEQSEVLALVK
jgi:hypothetical protein